MNVRKDFLDLVQETLCHDRQYMCIRPGPSLHCQLCQTDPIRNVYKYICRDWNQHLYSCELAQAYYDMTKDPNVPVQFILVANDNILPARIENQLLMRLKNAVEFYKAILAPFTQNSAPFVSSTPSMTTFMSDYIDAVTHQPRPKDLEPNEEHVLKQLLDTMNQMFRSKDTPNPFEYYMRMLVPYVKQCDPTVPLLPPDDSDDTNLVMTLMTQLQRSQWVRNQYSPYSMYFDLMHVMVGCYVSSSNIHVVANWALDFMSRICAGQFFWKQFGECPFVVQLQQILHSEVSHRKKPNLYYVLREIQRGHAAESLSSFLPNYLQLERLVKDKFNGPSMAADMLFPAILFEDVSDQLGFAMQLGHVACNMDLKTGVVKKGTFQAARKIHAVVAKFVNQVRAFDTIKNPWTIDTLKQFLESAPTLEKDLTEVSKLLLMPQEQDTIFVE